MQRSPGEKSLQCCYCFEAFDKNVLPQHIRQSHISKSDLICKLCDAVYTIASSLRSHVHRNHKNLQSKRSRTGLNEKRLFHLHDDDGDHAAESNFQNPGDVDRGHVPGDDDPDPSDDDPGDGDPGDVNPGDGNTGDGNPGDGDPGNGNPGDGNRGDGDPGDGNPGDSNPCDGNPTDGDPGDGDPGDGDPGDHDFVDVNSAPESNDESDIHSDDEPDDPDGNPDDDPYNFEDEVPDNPQKKIIAEYILYLRSQTKATEGDVLGILRNLQQVVESYVDYYLRNADEILFEAAGFRLTDYVNMEGTIAEIDCSQGLHSIFNQDNYFEEKYGVI